MWSNRVQLQLGGPQQRSTLGCGPVQPRTGLVKPRTTWTMTLSDLTCWPVSPKTATARYTRRRTLRDRTSLQDRTSSSKSRPALGLVQSRVGLDTETRGGGPRPTGAGAESGVSRKRLLLLNRRSQMCRPVGFWPMLLADVVVQACSMPG